MKVYVFLTFLGLWTGICKGNISWSQWHKIKLQQTNKPVIFTDSTISSVLSCADTCMASGNCVAFAHDKQVGSCIGFSSMAANNFTNITTNMKYFELNSSSSGGLGIVVTSSIFTNCGVNGSTGPTLADCQSSYNTAWSMNSLIFDVVAGVQSWRVPETGLYRIEACGASGGYGDVTTQGNSFTGSDLAGGRGAKIVGTFNLIAGTTLNIVCGQMGSNASWSETGGGGGGTFIYTGNIGGSGLLLAAGGGGGAGEENTGIGLDGQSGEQSISTSGLVGSGISANGGIGYGGVGGTYSSAGAGWYSDGANMISSYEANPGSRWHGGMEVSDQLSPDIYSGAGGFGGGGSGCLTNGGGGGGGYTGGSGTDLTARTDWAGSGAGSYNVGTDQINESGYNEGHGYVEITKV